MGEDVHHPRLRPRDGADERERPSAVGALVVADIHGVLRPGCEARRPIPYAEGPDVAVMTNYFLGHRLSGGSGWKVPADLRGVTGFFLANVLEGGPADVKHPRLSSAT